ncbi:hypothetical protein [Hymenobacter volaticus]|uniref:TonB C-terminal domain-containing protein n=1 Tax=Hymenobacter volaticus TaxID=2932254 RepID=A0ABY4GDE7_9BACT|nr:hypothetical protein [Hymenobacter volaticus]UOQ68931.1 hypothetical protein MUN86_24820 [Hymenobacter volaticus]
MGRSVVTLGCTLSLSLLGHYGWGQVPTPGENNSPFRLLPLYEPEYSYAERMPFYKDGGNKGLLALIAQNRPTRPPGVKGLFLTFTVDKNGKPTQPRVSAVPSDIRIPTSTYYEVARLLNQMKDFVPAQQKGNPVNVSLTVPLIPMNK